MRSLLTSSSSSSLLKLAMKPQTLKLQLLLT
jgi:hypothetical protein